MENEDLNKVCLTDKEICYIIELLVNNDRKQLADCIKEQLFKKDLNE